MTNTKLLPYICVKLFFNMTNDAVKRAVVPEITPDYVKAKMQEYGIQSGLALAAQAGVSYVGYMQYKNEKKPHWKAGQPSLFWFFAAKDLQSQCLAAGGEGLCRLPERFVKEAVTPQYIEAKLAENGIKSMRQLAVQAGVNDQSLNKFLKDNRDWVPGRATLFWFFEYHRLAKVVYEIEEGAGAIA